MEFRSDVGMMGDNSQEIPDTQRFSQRPLYLIASEWKWREHKSNASFKEFIVVALQHEILQWGSGFH